MLSLPIGFLLTLGVLFFAVDSKSWPLFINYHSIVIVVIGTFAILVFATPTNVLLSLVKALRKLGRRAKSFIDYMGELEQLAKTRTLSERSDCELINAAVGFWEGGVSHEMFIVLLSQKHKELEDAHLDAVHALRHLAKYPPALGMTGTVIGLVGLFANLGAVNKSGLGPSLAMAMTATFFGLVLSNGLITPMADRLQIQYLSRRRLLTEIYQAILLINRGESLELIHESNAEERSAA